LQGVQRADFTLHPAQTHNNLAPRIDYSLLASNLTNPTLHSFALGIFATAVISDLEIPTSTSKFISLYLHFSIDFKGWQELSHSAFSMEIVFLLLFGLKRVSLIPFYVFFIMKGHQALYHGHFQGFSSDFPFRNGDGYSPPVYGLSPVRLVCGNLGN
jgi:hypothetical protein